MHPRLSTCVSGHLRVFFRSLAVAIVLLNAACGGGGGGSGSGSSPAPVMETLTVSSSTGGSVSGVPSGINCGLTCTASYSSGTSVTLTQTPAAGYAFSGWGGACSGTLATCTVTMSAAQTVSASFTASPVNYVLSITNTGSGSGNVTSNTGGISCATSNIGACSASYLAGTSVTLTATATAGSGFTGWSGACSGTAITCVVPMAAARNVTATFFPYLLTVTDAGTGSGTITSSSGAFTCGSSGTCTTTTCTSGTCSASLAGGTSVTLAAIPASGFLFSGWTGACSGTASTCTLTMSAAQNATATFISSSVCAQTSSSTTLATIVANSTGTGFITNNFLNPACPIETTYHAVYGICYGNYAIQVNTYANAPANTTLSMWANSSSCWGINQSEPTNNLSNPTYWNAPVATRGFSQGAVTLLTPSGGMQVSGLDTQYASATTPCPSSGASQSVCAKWSMSVPGVSAGSAVNTANNFYTTWDAMMDIYFHATATPAAYQLTTFDLQIYQMIMEFQEQGVPAWSTYSIGKHTTKTIGGVTYLVSVNMGDPGSEGAGWIGRGGAYNCVSLIPLPTYPTTVAAGGTGSYLWGLPSAVHDVGGIIAWLSQPKTINGVTGIFDDAGNLDRKSVV